MKDRTFLILTLAGVVLAISVAQALGSSSQESLPPVPGQTYHAVTQATIDSTVCVRGWTATIRPPRAYTSALKSWLFKDRGLPGTVAVYQLDHLISLELGGAPYSTQNLWMQPVTVAHRDDALENGWREKLCAGELTLKQAREAELAYKRANG